MWGCYDRTHFSFQIHCLDSYIRALAFVQPTHARLGTLALLLFLVHGLMVCIEPFVSPQSPAGYRNNSSGESRWSRLKFESWFSHLLCDLRQSAQCHRSVSSLVTESDAHGVTEGHKVVSWEVPGRVSPFSWATCFLLSLCTPPALGLSAQGEGGG